MRYFKEIKNECYPYITIKCRCGHSVRILYNNHKIFCSHCGKFINTPKKKEFKDNILKLLNNNVMINIEVK